MLHLSLEKIGPHLVQHVSEQVVNLGEQDRLIDAGGVLVRDELLGVAVLSFHALAWD